MARDPQIPTRINPDLERASSLRSLERPTHVDFMEKVLKEECIHGKAEDMAG